MDCPKGSKRPQQGPKMQKTNKKRTEKTAKFTKKHTKMYKNSKKIKNVQKCLSLHPRTDAHTRHWPPRCGRCANDPSAGSPTETLLRLLLPLSDKVHKSLRSRVQELNTAALWIIHRITQSVGATGGVYKGQGRSQHQLMTRTY